MIQSLYIDNIKFNEGEKLLTSKGVHEIMYIYEGQGNFYSEEEHISFVTGDFFLIRKDQDYKIIFNAQTKLYQVRFNEKTRLLLKELVENSKGLATSPGKTKSPLNRKVSLNKEDQVLLIQLFQTLLYLTNDKEKNINLIFYHLLCVIMISERNLTYRPINKDIPQDKIIIRSIIKYINKNIKYPEKLTLQVIADNFNFSINKLGAYFKKETNQSVKQYINACKMEIIGEKIINSEISFSEIAYEYGFVDESHLNKNFKKQFGYSPSEYRKMNIQKN